MALDLTHLTESDYTPADDVERNAVATWDLQYHQDHGDSIHWAEFEWEDYRRLIAKVLAAFRSDVAACG